MSVVTRNTLWFYAGDIPYIDLEVKGTQFFVNFRKSLTYCIPDGKKKALWFEGETAAKRDGIDVVVPEWSWWLIMDDTTELSCSNDGPLGNLFRFTNSERGVQISFSITVEEAKDIKKAVEQMIDEIKKEEPFPLDTSLRVLRPYLKLLAYPIKAYRWKALRRYPTTLKKGLEWNPDL